MNENQPAPESMVSAAISFGAGPWKFSTKVTVSTEPTRLRQLIPLVQVLSNAMVDAVSKDAEQLGQEISCRKGCGACCRQLVPIAPVEARHIADLVEKMPEPRRAEIKARFDDARRRYEEAGLLDRLRRCDEWNEEDYRAVGREHFALGVPCPFLEDESCSIHADRPVPCREYLVTSPAEWCARPFDNPVRILELPFKTWWALARFSAPPVDGRFIPWVPLSMALDWAARHSDTDPVLPGPEMLSRLFGNMTGKEAPPLPAFG